MTGPKGDPGELFMRGLSFLQEAVKLIGKEAKDDFQRDVTGLKDSLRDRQTRGAGQPHTAQRADAPPNQMTLVLSTLEDIALDLKAVRQILTADKTPPPRESRPGFGDEARSD